MAGIYSTAEISKFETGNQNFQYMYEQWMPNGPYAR
jgi:hypothetical protein